MIRIGQSTIAVPVDQVHINVLWTVIQTTVLRDCRLQEERWWCKLMEIPYAMLLVGACQLMGQLYLTVCGHQKMYEFMAYRQWGTLTAYQFSLPSHLWLQMKFGPGEWLGCLSRCGVFEFGQTPRWKELNPTTWHCRELIIACMFFFFFVLHSCCSYDLCLQLWVSWLQEQS